MLVHVPSGQFFNRKNEPLSIAGEFDKALEQLRCAPFEWLDCEGLERRHNIGRGTLIVLDVPVPYGTYIQRHGWLEEFFKPFTHPSLCKEHEVFIPRMLSDLLSDHDNNQFIDDAWGKLQLQNHHVNCEFYEGLVAKKDDSLYPMQLRSPDVEYPFWVKHRWKF